LNTHVALFYRYRRYTAVSIIPSVYRGLPSVENTISGSSYKRVESAFSHLNSNHLVKTIRTEAEKPSFRTEFISQKKVFAAPSILKFLKIYISLTEQIRDVWLIQAAQAH
jgi:hypothetical protein